MTDKVNIKMGVFLGDGVESVEYVNYEVADVVLVV